jgi:transcriptional regulator with XRE-family HTH domain
MQPPINLKEKYPELEGIVSRLLELMSTRKLSQRDLCEKTGISQGQFAKVFIFKGIVSGHMWMRFAIAGFDVGWLLTGKSSEIQDREISRLNIIVEELRSLLRK